MLDSAGKRVAEQGQLQFLVVLYICSITSDEEVMFFQC